MKAQPTFSSLILLLLALACSQAFVTDSRSFRPATRPSDAVLYSSEESAETDSMRDDNVDAEASKTTEPMSKSTPPSATTTKSSDRKRTVRESMLFLQSLGAITGRGEFATPQQHDSAASVVAALEKANPTKKQPAQSELMYGRWELFYCSTQLFRSSPFFMAGRAVCTTDAQRDQYNWFCDLHRQALAISRIQAVRQIVTRTGRLVSEFEVSVGAVPFLHDLTPFSYSGGMPLAIEGALVSSADYTATANGTAWDLHMDTVQVKGSNLPFLRSVLDGGLRLESRRLAEVLEQAVPNYQTPRPVFRTTYLDEQVRISRDQDDNIFCYIKTSDDDTLTDYSDRDADLGLNKLLEGFNDAVTKIYL